MQDCLFCRIARGQVPAHIVDQDDDLVAFLDIHPVRPGHVLMIPREHHAYFDDLPPPLAAAMMAKAQRLAKALKAAYAVERVALFCTGIHVAHAHAHLVPMHEPQDVTSTQYIAQKDLAFVMPPQPPAAELEAAAKAVRQALAA